jgi:hypothetical protein
VRINPRVLYCFSEAQLIAVGMIIVGAAAWYLSGERRPTAVATPPEALRA